ncbi:toprim domain-containing protein [Acinetobacter baumannii]|nr:hypothetical protein [Acinetobacter baumannii]EKY1523256.1 hypothetical protein [Acinetobacter baumannii]
MTSKNKIYKHLISRELQPWAYKGVIVDEVNNVCTFLIHNLSGQLIGYQEYRPDILEKSHGKPRGEGRYFTYVTEGQTLLWGLERLNPKLKHLYVVEGAFKAAYLHRLGFNAVAIFGNKPSVAQMQQLSVLPYELIGIGDNDEAGAMLPRAIGKGSVSPKDLDEMSISEVYLFVRSLT